MTDNRIPDYDLEFLLLGYQSMSKSEHSPRTLQLLSLLNELKNLRKRDEVDRVKFTIAKKQPWSTNNQ